MYAVRITRGPVDLAFTDRYGGVSGAPFDSLNLAWAVDDPDALAENHRRLIDDFAPGDEVAALSQVHGNEVAVVGPEGPSHDLHGHLHATADGVVTGESGVTLMVRAADCVPLLFADESGAVIGAAHCGRPGLVAGIVPATVEALADLGAGRLTAWIGPHVCGRCYEVPAQLRADVAAVEPAGWGETSWGTPAVDLNAGVRAQLGRAGVEVVDVSRCTRESDDLFSYRRDGSQSGRQAGIIRRCG